MAYMHMPIKLIGLAAGYGAGILGATHMSLEDMALMRTLPGITVISPADGAEIVKAVLAASDTPAPTYIRLTGQMNMPIVYKNDYEFQIGKSIQLRKGTDVCIIAICSMVYPALRAAGALETEGVSASLLNMHTLKPLDEEAVYKANEEHRFIFTIEEHNVIGGLYGAVAETLCKMSYKI